MPISLEYARILPTVWSQTVQPLTEPQKSTLLDWPPVDGHQKNSGLEIAELTCLNIQSQKPSSGSERTGSI